MRDKNSKHRSQHLSSVVQSNHRLDLFYLNSKPSKFKKSHVKPIYAKENSGSAWRILFFLIAGLLLAFASLEASPPFSRGARPIALGNGYSATSGDGYSLFYNPAGLNDIHQEEFIVDYGRFDSAGESPGTDFNGIYTRPWKWKEYHMPLAFGFYAEQPIEGAHIIDFTGGTSRSVPMERWSKGFIKTPTTGGAALTLRHQQGETRSSRIGESAISIAVTGGFHTQINRKNSAGLVIRNLYLGSGNAPGAAISAGFQRIQSKRFLVMADLEYGSGGIWRFKPGVEWNFLRGVLRPRLGWGSRDNESTDSVATGVGFYLSPVQLDISYLVPVKTLTDDTAQFRASFIYRFGKPQFTEIYYDRALEAASQLDSNVLDLSVQEAELKASLEELQQKVRLAQEEIADSRTRIENLKKKDVLGKKNQEIAELKDRIRSLESQLAGQRKTNQILRTEKATIRTHVVVPGDTLQGLSEKYYNDASQWKKIFNRNADKIDRGLPRVGEKLVIP